MRIEIDTTNKYIVIGATVNAKEFINEIYELLGDDYVNYSIVKPIDQSLITPQTFEWKPDFAPYYGTETGAPVINIPRTTCECKPEQNQELTSTAYQRQVLGLSDEEIKNDILEKRTKTCNCNPEIEEGSCCGGCKSEELK